MPFTMIHLYVAKKLAEDMRVIDLPQFYLGSLAPDAVHFRENYVSDHKKASHMCVGDEQWGFFTNNDEWSDNVVAFLRGRTCSQDYSFYFGYCAHILTDIYNNISIWTPFRLRYYDDPDARGRYHLESADVDSMQYGSCLFREELWDHLRNSHGIDLPWLTAEEINKLRDSLLYTPYPAPSGAPAGKIVPRDPMEFTVPALGYVTEKLKNVVK